MANTEMNYVEGGGIYELARVTATSSMTPRQVLTALVTQAGDSLTWAANNRLDKLRISIKSNDSEYIFRPAIYNNYTMLFSAITGSSYIYIYTIGLNTQTGSSSTFKYCVNNAMSTYTDGSTTAMSSLSQTFVGDWVLYYE